MQGADSGIENGKEAARAQYEAPLLVELGTISDLTRGVDSIPGADQGALSL
jgi:hypothetical protein